MNPATGFLFLLGTAAVLSSGCCHTARTAGLDDGRAKPPVYGAVWDTAFTPQQWLSMLREREHQPITWWRGAGAGSIDGQSCGGSAGGLSLRQSRSGLLENNRSLDAAIGEHPLVFLPLLDDGDPETVLTGVAVYERLRPQQAGATEARRIAEAFRRLLRDHPDVRVRTMAVQTLAWNAWLTPTDVKRGLEDEANTVRVTTALLLTAANTNPLAYDEQGRLVQGQATDLARRVAWNEALAPILLEHLNDPHFLVRKNAASQFRALFRHWCVRADGARAPVDSAELPAQIDWVRSDWPTRQKTQEQWRQWWADQGHDALLRAHPGLATTGPSQADRVASTALASNANDSGIR